MMLADRTHRLHRVRVRPGESHAQANQEAERTSKSEGCNGQNELREKPDRAGVECIAPQQIHCILASLHISNS